MQTGTHLFLVCIIIHFAGIYKKIFSLVGVLSFSEEI